MNKIYAFFVLIMLSCLLQLQLNAQQIAFPGAEGAGRFTSGGRGTAASPTKVFEVTSLDDNNVAGTLRYACNQSTGTYPYRTIIFRVSGTIHLGSKLGIPRNTTIAGQTAPGGGICLADFPVVINGDNIIVRYLRIRMGDKNQLKTTPSGCGVPVAPFSASCMPLDGSGGDDAFGDLGHKNLIIDHCSVSWSSDEALTFYRGDSLTLQWNLISEPLNYSYHFETGDADFENHGYGGIWGALHGSFHHNLIAHARNRTPRFGGNSTYAAGAKESADFRNNVLYNWGINNIYGGEGGQYNLVNNYYKYGPNTSSGVRYRIVGVDYSDAFPYASYYLDGNYVDGSATNTANNWTGAYMKSGNAADSTMSKVNTPFLAAYLPATTQTPQDAYDSVLKKVGAILPARDTLDTRIINDVKNRTGKIIDVQGNHPHATPYAQTVNAWPNLASTAAPADTDHDGMPDDWETANSLNPNDATDRGIFAPNGYTNLENYLNSIQGNINPDPVPGGTAASATWPLLTDQLATTDGSITATNQLFSAAVTGVQYGNTFGTVAGWQRAATTSYLPADYSAGTYLEYSITPAANKKFTAQKIEMGALGGGTGTAKMAIYYSLDNFATSFPAGTCTYNGQGYDATVAAPVSLLNTSTSPLTGQQIATISSNIEVASGQTLSMRVYMWASSANKYFASQQVKISGVTADALPLPLQLLQFSAGLENGQTKLHWQTAYETNMRVFEIEKSEDGSNYSSIGTVSASNNSIGSYAFSDNTTINGAAYYRLKMLNKNGGFTYSYVIVVRQKPGDKAFIYPNPASNTITLSHQTINSTGFANIFNMEGKKLMTVSLIPGSTQTSFPVKTLAAGQYVLQYSNGKELHTLQLIKL